MSQNWLLSYNTLITGTEIEHNYSMQNTTIYDASLNKLITHMNGYDTSLNTIISQIGNVLSLSLENLSFDTSGLDTSVNLLEEYFFNLSGDYSNFSIGQEYATSISAGSISAGSMDVGTLNVGTLDVGTLDVSTLRIKNANLELFNSYFLFFKE